MKTREDILKECVYAVACCVDHYDTGLSEDGFKAVYEALDKALPVLGTSQCYRERMSVASPEYPADYPEFRDRIIWPADWWVTEDYFREGSNE